MSTSPLTIPLHEPSPEQAPGMDAVRIKTNCGGWTITRKDRKPIVQQGMLDELLRNGLKLPPPQSSKDGLIIMVRGKAGTGKSTLALQLAANFQLPWQRQLQQQGIAEREFFSLEQDHDELLAIYCQLVANQSRSRLKLLAATSEKANALEMMVRELLGLLGAKGSKTPAGKVVREILQEQDEPKAKNPVQGAESAAGSPPDSSVRLAPFVNPLRICFNRVKPAEPEPRLKDDPLSRAYSFVEKFQANLDRNARPILFIDGLSILSEEDRVRLEMASLIDSLRQRCLVGIIAYEPVEGGEESLDHQVDVVIELQEKHLSAPIDYIVHELHFKKTRYQEAALGWHQYKIRDYGLEIYPSVHFQVHSHLYMAGQLVDSLTPIGSQRPAGENAKKDQPEVETGWSVIEQVLGGIKPGDSVALLGPRGAFKTTLTLDFLFRSHQDFCPPKETKPEKLAGRKTQHGLLVSIIDNEDTLRKGQRCPLAPECGKQGMKCSTKCLEHLFLFYQRPGCIASSEFLYYLKTRLQVAREPIKRLAFWDLTQLEHRFPLLANDPMFVPALLDLFKMRSSAEKSDSTEKSDSAAESDSMVKSVFMGAANAQHSNAIAAVADNVIFCWRDRVRPKERDNPALPEKIAEIWGKLTGKERGENYLMLYVDRTSGGFGTERQKLFAFPISKESALLLPQGDWSTDGYGIPHKLIPCFEQSEGQIRHVTEMQGFGHEHVRDDEPPSGSGGEGGAQL